MAVLCLRCEVAKIECVGIVGMADVCKGLCKILQRSLHFLRHWKFGFALSCNLRRMAMSPMPPFTNVLDLGISNACCV